MQEERDELHPTAEEVAKAAYAKVGVNVESTEPAPAPTTSDTVSETRASEPDDSDKKKSSYKTRATKSE